MERGTEGRSGEVSEEINYFQLGGGGTHGIAKDKDRDGEGGNGGGVVVKLLVHEANAGGEHGRRQGAGSALVKEPTNHQTRLGGKGKGEANYLTSVMLLTRRRIVHFNLCGKFLGDVRVISCAPSRGGRGLTLGSLDHPGCPSQ